MWRTLMYIPIFIHRDILRRPQVLKYFWPSQNILVRWDLLDFEYNFWSHHRMKGHHHEYWNHPWFKSKSLQILKSQLCHRIWWQYIKIYQTIKNWSFTFYFLRVKPFDSIRPSYLLSCCDIFLAWLPIFNSKSLSASKHCESKNWLWNAKHKIKMTI